MSKITLLIAFICLCVAVHAQNDREICRRVTQRCESRATRNGRNSDVSDIFNDNCRRLNRNWRNITRCELARATCQLTLERCDTLSCENVRRALDRRPAE
ncbi:uncharacterized protein LOC108118198 [Drosophila eugracilis]|uniref:uncharacterized protein LOC108118198 n=1 Tax=Drosophila eugracilis TaxID=29029 RepID=UPI0007E8847C|nr:uncharacterized protein LOC108118198 [Drosophila eugracilis]